MRLVEARAILSELQRFKKETGSKFSGIISALRDNVDAGMFLHFTNKNKVGVNPHTKWSGVPAGVYVYPLTAQTLKDLMTGSRVVLSHYALNYKNAYLLRVRRGTTATIQADGSSNFGAADYRRAKSALNLDARGEAWASEMEAAFSRPIERVLKLTYYLAARDVITHVPADADGYFQGVKTGVWTKGLRRAGLSAIVDNGSGTIDSREATQGVLLDPGVIEIVAFGKNPRPSMAGGVEAVFRSLVRAVASMPHIKKVRELEVGDVTRVVLHRHSPAQKRFAAKGHRPTEPTSISVSMERGYRNYTRVDINLGTNGPMDHWDGKPSKWPWASSSRSVWSAQVSDASDGADIAQMRSGAQTAIPLLAAALSKYDSGLDSKG